jgi:hypothetical protein
MVRATRYIQCGIGRNASSSPPASVYWSCLRAVQAQIQALNLPGLTTLSIVIKKLPLDRNMGTAPGLALPAVLITPDRETMDPQAGTNSFDDVVYSVRVTMFDRDNQEPTVAANLDRYLAWRQQIARAFRNQTLAGVPEVYSASVEPAEVVNADAWARNLYASALLLRFVSREPRGA